MLDIHPELVLIAEYLAELHMLFIRGEMGVNIQSLHQ
jgi:hypothetical protein